MSHYSKSKFIDKDHNSSWQKTFIFIPEKSKVLDIGCSSGTFGSKLIKEKNCKVDGIEIDEEDIKLAKKKLNNVYRINIETDDINIATKYDVIFMGDVIEHLARPIPTLNKLIKLLKEDGQLVFSIANITHMSTRLMILKGEIIYGKTGLLDETHLHFYNSKEIKRVLESAGFKIIKLDYTVNDIPQEFLNNEFSEIGLTMNSKFKTISQSVDAVAYQFIGVASPSKVTTGSHNTLPDNSPPNIVEKYVNELKSNYDKNLAGVIADRDRILIENQKLIEERQQIQPILKVLKIKPVKHILNRVISRHNKNNN